MLGSLRVRRGDNSPVHPAEWRTGKTVDLLRLLALNVGRPVRIDSLLDKLWPDVAEAKGRASLRTAASQIRRTLSCDCIERRMDGLALTGAWVDVSAFRDLAVEARASHRSGDHAKVVCLTRQADAMYLGDFEAHDGGSDWAVELRESMAAMRVALLTDAAESAVELRWLQDAVDLASLVIDADPYSDRGHRGLMSAFAGLGETDRALRVYTNFRAVLHNDLGISPSAQTQALQMSLLSGTADLSQAPGWVGHEDDCARTVSLIRGATDRGVRVMCVNGATGSGREAVIDAALDRVGGTALRLRPQGPGALPSKVEMVAAAKRAKVVVLPPLDACDDSDIADLVSTIAALTPVDGVTVTIPVDRQHLEPLLMELEMVSLEVVLVEMHTLTRVELERLASALLCGPAAPGLVDVLMNVSGGLSGKATSELRRWLAKGRVLWTPSGLDIAPSHHQTSELEIDKITRRILEQVCPLGTDIVSLLALLDRPATAAFIAQLLDQVAWPDITENDVDVALDQLADLGALQLGPHGYEFMHRRMLTTIEAWLRHGVRRQLHRRLAESPLLPEVDRPSHWIKAAASLHAAEFDEAAATAVVDEALSNALPSTVLSPRPDSGFDLTARVALLEEAVRRALEPLLAGAMFSISLSVVPDVLQPAAIATAAAPTTAA